MQQLVDAEVFQVSHTAVQSFDRCEQQYFYSYIERLRRKDRQPRLELGSILHSYLDGFYAGVRDGQSPEDAHSVAQLQVSVRYVPDAKRYAQAAYAVGEQELSQELLSLPEKARRISDRYFEARGRDDAERHEILLVEEAVESNLTPTIVNNGRVDLVTRDRNTGLINLWEHKSFGAREIPLTGIRLRDIQTLLYGIGCEYEIDSIIWNYLRTKEPTVPVLVYKGTAREGLTHSRMVDTTWPVFREAIDRYHLKVGDYEDVRTRLEGRELSVFFPRIHQVIVTDPNIMLHNYAAKAMEMRRKVRRWREGKAIPIRSIGRDCDFCEFAPLCMAVLVTGDDEDIRTMRYRQRK